MAILEDLETSKCTNGPPNDLFYGFSGKKNFGRWDKNSYIYPCMGSKELLINSFVYANFNYCPLIWHFCPALIKENTKKKKKRSIKNSL